MDGGDQGTVYLTGRSSPLKLDEVVDILRNPDDSRTIREPPCTPRGGEVYLYKIDDFEHGIWKKDNFHFRADGKQKQPKISPVVIKEFHKAYKEDKSTTKRFVKAAFYLLGGEPQYVLVHYRGDHTLGLPDPKVSKREKSIMHQAQKLHTLHSTVNTTRPCQERTSIHQVNTRQLNEDCRDIEAMNLDVRDVQEPQTVQPPVLSDTATPIAIISSEDHSSATYNLQKRKQENSLPNVHRRVKENTSSNREDVEYLYSEKPCVKQRRLEQTPEENNACEILVSEVSPCQTLQGFTEKLLTNRDFIRTVQRIQALSKHGEENSNLQRSRNPYLSLNDEVGNLWNRDVIAVMCKLQWHLSPELFDSRWDSSEYLKLISSVIVGAYHTQIDTG